MTLNPHPSYPLSHVYVVKLHRDCVPRVGEITGCVEHVTTGRVLHFQSAAELASCLLSHAAQQSS
jgi:hypothetical protein